MSRRKIKLCECGCGEKTIVSPRGKVRRFINGHVQRGRKASEELRRRLSKSMKDRLLTGERHPSCGRKYSKETREKLSEANRGKKASEDTKKKMSEAQRGENHPNWQGGISDEGYGSGWTRALKKKIRKRDGYTCQLCNEKQRKGGRNHSVHHIDYDKKNNNESNLITLCNSCHMETNFSREEWQEYFEEAA